MSCCAESVGLGRSFEEGVEWKVGDGGNISFLEDSWLNCGALKEMFPRLYSLGTAKAAKVAEIGKWSNGVWIWHLCWRRSLFDWEKLSCWRSS